MGDLLRALLTVVLIGTNAFFVAAEFSLISARRDRLDTLAGQGKHRAATVVNAGEQLPLMFAGAQLGITVSSILLGRIGEPAVADLLAKPLGWLGASNALLHSTSLVAALAIVVTVHVLLGEMVPKNITLAGPEKAAMFLVPPYLLYIRVARPVIALYNWCAGATLRVLRVQPKDELDVTVSTVELSEMIAESLSEGLLDHQEHTRLTRALQIRNRVVADVAVPLAQVRAVPVAAPGSGPTVAALEKALAETGYSRFPVVGADGRFVGYVHIKDVLALGEDPRAVVDREMVRPLPLLPESLPLAEALSQLRRTNSHLALVTATTGDVVAMVALADLVEDLIGTVRDGAHHA
ncbi:hemolysin family protein [Mycobacterium botniense]|uniref:Membrane protein n=1 Tax=Mycobacterium botniense TaxID=84962 RepID=A0A7I9Y1Q9_9MYCO|nr:hemolysin family protein [Mycobacterium botniense]GFG75974.1 membrane protein [Mycobacterium botniense]